MKFVLKNTHSKNAGMRRKKKSREEDSRGPLPSPEGPGQGDSGSLGPARRCPTPCPPACLWIQALWGPCESLVPPHIPFLIDLLFLPKSKESGFLPEHGSIVGRNEKIKSVLLDFVEVSPPSLGGRWSPSSLRSLWLCDHTVESPTHCLSAPCPTWRKAQF